MKKEGSEVLAGRATCTGVEQEWGAKAARKRLRELLKQKAG